MKVIAALAILTLLIQSLFTACWQAHSNVYEKEIDGKIDSVYIDSPYTVITVKSVQFKIKAKPFHGQYKLENNIQKGDRVFKRANSDTLALTHQEDMLFYFKLN